MREKLLLIGASGPLGRRLQVDLAGRFEVVGTCHAQRLPHLIPLDLREPEQVAALIEREAPGIVVVAAALSNVAFCEAEPEASERVNVEGVRQVVARARGRRVVLFSSDAVFDGSREAFSEADPPCPRCVYGEQKTRAEQFVRELPGHLVLRSARFYTRERGDGRFVDHVLRSLAAGGVVEAPLDTPGNPTFVEDLSRATLALLARGREGTWHVAGPRVPSLYETARTIAQVFGFDEARVRPVPRDHASPLPRLASVLETDRARAEGLCFRSLLQGLEEIRRQGRT